MPEQVLIHTSVYAPPDADEMVRLLSETFSRNDPPAVATGLIAPGVCLHLFLLGVSPRFAGQGVARQLVSACLENGASIADQGGPILMEKPLTPREGPSS